ncbi:MAG TPA: hypothetical protein VEI83_15075 [Acidimicrobiales bacterium]|nr:hypothetical protein [Acidimicrobiales bacterium]
MARKKAARELVEASSDLIESTDDLRAVLLRFKRRIADLQAVAQGEGGVSLVEAVEDARGDVMRAQVTDALEVFETARHRVRVAMIRLAIEQGSNASAVGRSIGISRQLAYRLASEVKSNNS